MLVAGTVASLRLDSAPPANGPTPVGGGLDASGIPGADADADRPAERADRGAVRVAPSAPSPTPKSPGPSPAGRRGPGGTCNASYYSDGQRTANGEIFDPNGYTAAHRTLPFNTRLRVTNVANGKSTVVRINDRGPFVADRCLDLSRAAFAAIASLSSGVVTVRYEIVG